MIIRATSRYVDIKGAERPPSAYSGLRALIFAGEAIMTTIYIIAAIISVLIALGHIQFRA